jgi:hypothetical protein
MKVAINEDHQARPDGTRALYSRVKSQIQSNLTAEREAKQA